MGCAFGNTSLESVQIPSSVTHIEADAFANCDDLINVSFEASDGWYVIFDNAKVEIDVTNTEKNAMNLRDPRFSEYLYSVWYRED